MRFVGAKGVLLFIITPVEKKLGTRLSMIVSGRSYVSFDRANVVLLTSLGC